MKLQRKTDWVDHLLGGLCVVFIWFCIMVVKEAKGHYDAEQAPKPKAEVRSMYPEIPQCDKELWLRIKDGCNEQADH